MEKMNDVVSKKNKKLQDEIIEKLLNEKWVPESCLQEFYYFCRTSEIEFCHKGHDYFISWDSDDKNNKYWCIFDRDLTNPLYKYNTIWEKEPRTDFKNLSDLAFSYKLKNDGRTIAEYICDYNKVPRILVPEPVDERPDAKVW